MCETEASLLAPSVLEQNGMVSVAANLGLREFHGFARKDVDGRGVGHVEEKDAFARFGAESGGASEQMLLCAGFARVVCVSGEAAARPQNVWVD